MRRPRPALDPTSLDSPTQTSVFGQQLFKGLCSCVRFLGLASGHGL